MTTNPANPLADIDPRLLSEAFRRARERVSERLDSDSLAVGHSRRGRRGTRDIYGLIRAAEKTDRRTTPL